MGGVRDNTRWMGTQQPTRMIVVTLVLLSAPASQALALHHNICSTPMKSIKLFPYETVYLSTNVLHVPVKMEAAGCVNDTQLLNMPHSKLKNSSLSLFDWNWHELTFLSCGNYIVKIGTEIVKFKHEVLPPHCLAKTRSAILTVGPNVQLGKKCKKSVNIKEVEQNKAECMWLHKGDVPDTDHSLDKQPSSSSIAELFALLDKQQNYDSKNKFFDHLSDSSEPVKNTNDDKNIFIFGNEKDPNELEDNTGTSLIEPEISNRDTFLNWPNINYDLLQPTSATTPTYNFNNDIYLDNHTGFTKHRHYREKAVPFFIGIVAFTVSICLRFCLCPGKSVVRRVTTVTVVSRHPVGPEAPEDQQDPPPSYVDVVNEATSSESPPNEDTAEPPPPAYADIVSEIQPPTYSEVEAQSMPAYEEVPLADQRVEVQTTQPQTDQESVPDAKGLAPSKNLLSKYRSQQKQFAFKVLEEE